MKTTIKRYLLTLLAVPALALSVGAAAAPSAFAVEGIQQGANSAQGTDQQACLFGHESGCDQGQTSLFKTISNVLLFVIGAVSVIMLIIGGIRYTISQGDQGAVGNAKNTILYAVIGIVVAILAYAIINFVISSFVPGNGNQ